MTFTRAESEALVFKWSASERKESVDGKCEERLPFQRLSVLLCTPLTERSRTKRKNQSQCVDVHLKVRCLVKPFCACKRRSDSNSNCPSRITAATGHPTVQEPKMLARRRKLASTSHRRCGYDVESTETRCLWRSVWCNLMCTSPKM